MAKINVYLTIVMKTRKIENMEIGEFIHKSSSKRSWYRIYSWLRRADVR